MVSSAFIGRCRSDSCQITLSEIHTGDKMPFMPGLEPIHGIAIGITVRRIRGLSDAQALLAKRLDLSGE
jgi:hypothetical protein